MPTLNKDNFLFSCNNIEKTVVINLNDFNGNLKNYSVALVAHDEHGKIAAKVKTFKEKKEASFTGVSYPLFLLIFHKEDHTNKTNYFHEQVEELMNKAIIPGIETGDLNFYFSAHEKLISETILNINSHYSITSNRETELGLLVFNNANPYNASIDTFYEFSELEKGIVVRKETLEKLTSYRERLEEMKSEIEAYIGDLIDSPEKNSIEKLLIKIKQGILLFKKHMNDKNNFLHDPTLPINQDLLNLLIQGFEKIKTDYPTKEDILKKNEGILLERKNFISQSISHLQSIQSDLEKKIEILSDAYISKIKETEQEVSLLIETLTAKEENIAALLHTEYSALKNQYNFFLEKISEELTNYTRKTDATINERKIQLRKEQSKLIGENGIDEFKKTLADEVLSEFAKHPTYRKYTELLAEIDNELADGCMSLQKVEALKKEIAEILPQLSTFKNEYKTKNTQVIQARKGEIVLIQQRLAEMERSVTTASKELYEMTAHGFPINDLNGILRELKLEAQTLTEDKFLILNKEAISFLRTKFETFNSDFTSKLAAANKKSDKSIRTKLHNLQQHTTVLEDTDFSEKLKSLLSKSSLNRNQLENIIDEFNSLRLSIFSTKLNNIAEKLEAHVKKLKGENPMSLPEKLINFLFKTTTKEKIQIEQKGIGALNEIKNYIASSSVSSANDVERLAQLYQTANTIFQEKILTRSRSCLFFKFNLVTSQRIAGETTELLGELKTAFKI